jgi:seryl-tRNA synthetase
MLDLRTVTENLETVRRGLERRKNAPTADLDRLAALSADRKTVLAELERLRQKRNDVSKSLATVDKNSEAFQTTREEMRLVGDAIKQLEAQITGVESALEDVLLGCPNIPHESVPDGDSSEANPVRRVWGEKPALAFTPKDHVDVGLGLGILDFERAGKISGSRFTILRGAGARMERALLQFMLDLHSDHHGYTEIWPPVMVKDSAMRGTGQLPKFKEDAFRIAMPADPSGEPQAFDWYLAPTAEVPVTNMHAEEVLDGAALPIAYTAYTPCFRSEAGSYGKDTRGLIRQHQFDKVELVRFTKPEDGQATLEALTGHAEQVLVKLGLHYRVVELCTGDLGFSSQKTYDIEVWLPAQNAYREISSCSWFGDFQARRAKIRFKRDAKAKPEHVHTLNGSGLAIGRTLVAILEQYQQADGSVVVPEALRPYMGNLDRISRAPHSG